MSKTVHKIYVRSLRTSDEQAWRILWDGYLAHYRQVLDPRITNHTWQLLIDDSTLHGSGAIDDNGGLVGLVHYHFHLSTWSIRDICYLEDLYVDPRSRGCGVGGALIEHVYAQADARGAPRVYWHTESSNIQAQTLYNKVATLTPFIQYRKQK